MIIHTCNESGWQVAQGTAIALAMAGFLLVCYAITWVITRLFKTLRLAWETKIEE